MYFLIIMMFIRLKQFMKGNILDRVSRFSSVTSIPASSSSPGNLLRASLKTTDLREKKNYYYLTNSSVVSIWYLTI